MSETLKKTDKTHIMTREQLIRKARYFGANVGKDFIQDKVTLTCIGVFLKGNILQLHFEVKNVSGLSMRTIVLPKDEKQLKDISVG